MDLNERKRKILHTIINEYVNSAEPVGSRHIAKNLDLGLSSATIRNEMSDLEEMGYLEQPHTSAGRIPSDKGYRFYVNELMGGYEFDRSDMEVWSQIMGTKLTQLDKVIRQASVVLSQLTEYTAVFTSPEMKHGAIKTVELVPIDNASVLMILVTNEGIMRNKRISISANIPESFFKEFSNVLKTKLSGLTLDEIDLPKVIEIKQAMGAHYEILFPILDFLTEIVDDIQRETEIYLSGTTNIFKFPEYHDVERAQAFFEFLDDKKSLGKAMQAAETDTAHNGGVRIRIGSENQMDAMQDLSLVTADYHLGNKASGKIGIIGPTRMNYSKVVANIEHISKYLNRLLEELYMNDNGG